MKQARQKSREAQLVRAHREPDTFQVGQEVIIQGKSKRWNVLDYHLLSHLEGVRLVGALASWASLDFCLACFIFSMSHSAGGMVGSFDRQVGLLKIFQPQFPSHQPSRTD